MTVTDGICYYTKAEMDDRCHLYQAMGEMGIDPTRAVGCPLTTAELQHNADVSYVRDKVRLAMQPPAPLFTDGIHGIRCGVDGPEAEKHRRERWREQWHTMRVLILLGFSEPQIQAMREGDASVSLIPESPLEYIK